MKLLSHAFPEVISNSNYDPISVTISKTISMHIEAISKTISNANPKSISESNSDHSHRSTLLQQGGLPRWQCETVGEHLSSRYVAQLDLSISSHICRNIVLGCDVCNCSSAVDSVLDARDQRL